MGTWGQADDPLAVLSRRLKHSLSSSRERSRERLDSRPAREAVDLLDDCDAEVQRLALRLDAKQGQDREQAQVYRGLEDSWQEARQELRELKLRDQRRDAEREEERRQWQLQQDRLKDDQDRLLRERERERERLRELDAPDPKLVQKVAALEQRQEELFAERNSAQRLVASQQAELRAQDLRVEELQRKLHESEQDRSSLRAKYLEVGGKMEALLARTEDEERAEQKHKSKQQKMVKHLQKQLKGRDDQQQALERELASARAQAAALEAQMKEATERAEHAKKLAGDVYEEAARRERSVLDATHERLLQHDKLVIPIGTHEKLVADVVATADKRVKDAETRLETLTQQRVLDAQTRQARAEEELLALKIRLDQTQGAQKQAHDDAVQRLTRDLRRCQKDQEQQQKRKDEVMGQLKDAVRNMAVLRAVAEEERSKRCLAIQQAEVCQRERDQHLSRLPLLEQQAQELQFARTQAQEAKAIQDGLSPELRRLEQTAARTEAELAAATVRANDAKARLKVAQDSEQEALTKLEQRDRELKKNKAVVAKLPPLLRELKTLKRELAQLKGVVQTEKALALDLSDASCAGASRQLRKACEEHLRQLRQLQDEAHLQDARLAELRAALQAATSETGRQAQQLARAEQHAEDWRRQHAGADSDLAQCRAVCAALLARVEIPPESADLVAGALERGALTEVLELLRRDCVVRDSRAEQRSKELVIQLREADAELQARATELQRRREEHDQTRRELLQCQEQSRLDTEKLLQQHQQQVDALRAELREECEQRLAQLREEQRLEADIVDSKARHEHSQWEDANEELERLRSQQQSDLKASAARRQELEDLRSHRAAAAAHAAALEAQLCRAERDGLRQKEDMEVERATLEEQRARLQHEVLELRAEAAKARGQALDAQGAQERVEAELGRQKQQVQRKDQELAALRETLREEVQKVHQAAQEDLAQKEREVWAAREASNADARQLQSRMASVADGLRNAARISAQTDELTRRAQQVEREIPQSPYYRRR